MRHWGNKLFRAMWEATLWPDTKQSRKSAQRAPEHSTQDVKREQQACIRLRPALLLGVQPKLPGAKQGKLHKCFQLLPLAEETGKEQNVTVCTRWRLKRRKARCCKGKQMFRQKNKNKRQVYSAHTTCSICQLLQHLPTEHRCRRKPQSIYTSC